MPLPPRIERASRQISSAARTLANLPKLIWCGVDPAGVLELAESARGELRLLQRHRHLGELALGELEAGDRLAELGAGAGVVERRGQRVAGRIR